MTTSLEIRLLGPFEAFVGGRPAEVTGPKRHALLALLALRGGRMVPVEVLVDALWGAEVPAAPRNAVQHHVSRLRGRARSRLDRCRPRRVRAGERHRRRLAVRGAAGQGPQRPAGR